MPDSYYSDEFVTLYHGDFRDVPEWMYAHVLVTDPPYGSQLMSTANSNPGGYGRRDPRVPGRQSAVIAGDMDSSTRDAALAAWGERPAIVFASPRLPEPPGGWEDRLVWDKRRPGTNGGPFRYSHEMIYARGLVRVDNSSFSILSAHPDQRDHIHAKPVQVMLRLVNVCPPGVITDPFAGSGSTLVAAKQLGRKSIGVEVNEAFCEIAAKRLAQDTLFGGVA